MHVTMINSTICKNCYDKSTKLPIALQTDSILKVRQIFFSFATDSSFTETGILVKQAWDVFKVGKFKIMLFNHIFPLF